MDMSNRAYMQTSINKYGYYFKWRQVYGSRENKKILKHINGNLWDRSNTYYQQVYCTTKTKDELYETNKLGISKYKRRYLKEEISVAKIATNTLQQKLQIMRLGALNNGIYRTQMV